MAVKCSVFWFLTISFKISSVYSRDLLFFDNDDYFEDIYRDDSRRFVDNYYESGYRQEKANRDYQASNNNYNRNRFINYYPQTLYDRSDTVNFPNFEQIFPSSDMKLYSEHGVFEKPIASDNHLKPDTHNDFDNVQAQMQATPNFEELKKYNRRPKFLTQNYKNNKINIVEEKPTVNTIKESNVQKIPKRIEEMTKYEEIDMIVSPSSTSTNIIRNTLNKNQINNTATKDKINDILKKYLNKLYTQKYNTTKKHKTSKLEDLNIEDDDQKSKFLNSDTFLHIKNKTINKIKNLLGIFTVVKFNNTECNATTAAGTWQGICYTNAECTKYNGTAIGTCANGYGVCCVFSGTCGGSSNQNCTYFKSPNYPDYYPGDGNNNNGGVVVPTTLAPTTTTAGGQTPDPRRPYWYYVGENVGYHGGYDGEYDGDEIGRQNDDSTSCTFSVYKKNSDVKQMRIDFIDLELTGPTNGTCTDERLVISGQNTNNQVPVICGYNTGQHVYVDVSTLSGPLQLMVLSNSGARKRFKIKICQFSDSSCTSPSSNCLQYYTGTTGVIQSFNYDQAATYNRSVPGYFNNLNYAICIRKEAGYCSITYTNVRNGVEYPFQLVNVDDTGALTIPQGQAGVDITNCPDDYIVIDGTRLCGDKLNDGSMVDDFTKNAPITDTSAGPIVVSVRTNSNRVGIGFKLFYTQNLCTNT